jgi:hypothetical protein
MAVATGVIGTVSGSEIDAERKCSWIWCAAERVVLMYEAEACMGSSPDSLSTLDKS